MKLFTKDISFLLLAQFFSAFADNALLIALIAQLTLLAQQQHTHILQELFVIPFILLAPLAGPFADRLPKSKVLLIGNIIKTLGAAFAAFHFNPFISYMIVGIGACIYSPAKYGILPEITDSKIIVKANSALEGSTILAILLGVLVGGFLVAINLNLALYIIFGFYFLASIFNLFISNTKSVNSTFPPLKLILFDFFKALTIFFKDKQTFLSLIGSASFWGAGAALRLALFSWVPIAIISSNEQTPPHLMGIMSVGIVIGAIISAKFLSIENLKPSVIAGIFIGPSIIFMILTSSTFITASAFLLLIGILGGIFLIPLNALIQEKGFHTVGSGRALAVQNFIENIFILLFSAILGFLTPKIGITYSSIYLGATLFIFTIITFYLFLKSK